MQPPQKERDKTGQINQPKGFHPMQASLRTGENKSVFGRLQIKNPQERP
jgi:hypothetical protein